MKRDWLTLAFGVVLVGTVVGLSLRQNMTTPRSERTGTPEPPPPVAAAAPAVAPHSATPAPSVPDRRPTDPTLAVAKRKPRIVVPAAVAEASAPSIGESGVALQVQSDVQGASVFLDREFVGTTPLTVRGLTAGQKQLNVTATGHEGYSATVDLTPGHNRVDVEFIRVRLNATVPVVHRHAMGACQGMLVASSKGLTYDTPNKTEAFTLTFADLDAFDVDYLKKNLRVKRREGKTWNFTNNNADALFVFHREVTKAREKLAATR
jgi:hypothetical protein